MTLFIIMMMFFREELRQVAELLGDEKRDGTCRVMTIGGLFMMFMEFDGDEHWRFMMIYIGGDGDSYRRR